MVNSRRSPGQALSAAFWPSDARAVPGVPKVSKAMTDFLPSRKLVREMPWLAVQRLARSGW